MDRKLGRLDDAGNMLLAALTKMDSAESRVTEAKLNEPSPRGSFSAGIDTADRLRDLHVGAGYDEKAADEAVDGLPVEGSAEALMSSLNATPTDKLEARMLELRGILDKTGDPRDSKDVE